MKIIHKFLLIIFVSLAFLQVTFSQQIKLFETIEEGTIQFSPDQTEKYSKINSSEIYTESKFVKIKNLSELQENGRIQVNIPDTNCDKIEYEAREVEYYSEDDYYWYGELIEKDSCECTTGNLTMISKDGRKYGQFSIDEELYEIQDLSRGLNILSKIVNSKVENQRCGVTIDDEGGGKENLDDFFEDEKNIGNCYVSILVLFTEAANAVETNINDRIDLAMRQTNQALHNSRIFSCDLRVRLAGEPVLIPIPFIETTSAETDVNTLATDPTIAAVRTARNADLVVLFTEGNYDNNNTFGVVQAIGPAVGSAFAVVETQSATTGRYVFAHEVSHLFGARHRKDPTPGIAHGYRLLKCFKLNATILNNGNQNWIQYFSNPNVRYKNKRTGKEGERDNAQVLRNAGCTVANFVDDPSVLLFTSIESENDADIYPVESICPCNIVSLNAEIYGPPGPYTYQWRISPDGINFSDVLSTGSYFGLNPMEFCTPDGEWCFDVCLGVNVFVELSVTAANGTQRIVTRRFVTDDIWEGQEWSCDDEFDGLSTPPGSNNISPHQEFFVYPNPVSEKINLDINIDTRIFVEAQITNVNSNKVTEWFSSVLERGSHSFSFDSDKLTTGVYIVKIRKGGKVISRKIVLLK